MKIYEMEFAFSVFMGFSHIDNEFYLAGGRNSS